MRLSEFVVQYHKELNPKLWEKDGVLKDDVYVALIKLSKAFIDFLEIDNSYIEDVIITGSNCNYNFKAGSDLDIHVVVNYPEFQKTCSTVDIEEMFKTKKNLWNSEHDIEINGIPTEMYVQNSDQRLPEDDSVYSLLKNEWLTPPRKIDDFKPDNEAIDTLVSSVRKAIKDVMKSKDLTQIKALQDKITAMRRSGLATSGQFSPQNLAFKALRDAGDISDLWDYYAKMEDENLSLEEMAAAEVNETEHVIDELFREIGLDVIFTQHFIDRITPGNEDSRDINVTPEEVIKAFKALRLQYGKQLLRAKFDKVAFQGLLKDMSTKLNIPFVIDYDRAYSGYHKLVAKTLMRKSDFKNDNFNQKVLQVRS